MNQLRDASVSRDQQTMQDLMGQVRDLTRGDWLWRRSGVIATTGLSEQVRNELLEKSSVHVGDAPPRRT